MSQGDVLFKQTYSNKACYKLRNKAVILDRVILGGGEDTIEFKLTRQKYTNLINLY